MVKLSVKSKVSKLSLFGTLWRLLASAYSRHIPMQSGIYDCFVPNGKLSSPVFTSILSRKFWCTLDFLAYTLFCYYMKLLGFSTPMMKLSVKSWVSKFSLFGALWAFWLSSCFLFGIHVD